MSQGVVDASARLFAGGNDGGCGYVGGMLGVDVHVGEGVDGGGEDYVPRFRGVFVDANFDGAEHVDLGGKCLQGSFELLGGSAALSVATLELESYDMFYHCDIW